MRLGIEKKRVEAYKTHIRLEKEPCYGLTKEFLSIIRSPTEFGTLALVMAPLAWLCNFLEHFSETQRQNQEERSLIHSRGTDKGVRWAVKVLRELRMTVRIVAILLIGSRPNCKGSKAKECLLSQIVRMKGTFFSVCRNF